MDTSVVSSLMRLTLQGTLRAAILNAPGIARRVGGMMKRKETAGPPPDVPGRPKNWREQIKADLAAQVEAGGTLYGFRPDGTCIARARDGDRVIDLSAQESS